MGLIKNTLQPIVRAAWYATHPKAALAAVRKGNILKLDDPKGWEFLAGGPTWTGKTVNENTVLQITSSWSAIRLISETIGTLPLHLYRETDTGREKAKDHPLYRLLHDQPNPFCTSVEWREALAVSLCVYGQAYSLVDRLPSRVIAIYPLVPTCVTQEVRNQGREVVYKVTQDGVEQEYKRGEIVPIKGFGLSPLQGYAPHQLHRQSLALTMAAEEYGARFFGNGARPSGLLMYDKVLTDEQRANAKKLFEMMHAGLENSHKLGILEAGMKYQQVTANNTDAQMVETRKQQIAEVARIWRVPLHLLMEADRATWANSEQENRYFLDYTLGPYLKRIEQTLNSTLLTREEQRRRMFIEFDVRGLLRGDSKARAEYYRNMRMIGAMSINEVRRAENLPTVEGGDDLHVPLNMSPVDQLRDILGGNDDATN